MDNTKIKILGKEINLRRLPLKPWCGLELLRKKMNDAISKKDFDNYFAYTVQTIEMASVSLPKINWEEVPWIEVAQAQNAVVAINNITMDFPILRGSGQEEKVQPWEYDGRSWYFWLNLFASNYGWEEEKIAELDVDTAIGLYQELTISDQMEKEWEWGLSETSYGYNSSTKKSEFKPLPRPDWMKPIIPKELPVVRMRRDMLPVGMIVDLQDKAKKNGI